jgi:hypothetical protein
MRVKMSYSKAIRIMEYWRQYDFNGRFKTNETLFAEEFLKNPDAFVSKHNLNRDNFYSDKSHNKKKNKKPP